LCWIKNVSEGGLFLVQVPTRAKSLCSYPGRAPTTAKKRKANYLPTAVYGASYSTKMNRKLLAQRCS
jgi:hypothetical protein